MGKFDEGYTRVTSTPDSSLLLIDEAPYTDNSVKNITVGNLLSGTNRLVYNVKDFGAVGDGITNDRLALNLAIAAANATLGVVYFPAGIYFITSRLTAPASYTTWRGAGKGTSVIKGTGNSDWVIFSNTTLIYWKLEDITFDINNVTAGSGVLLHNVSNSIINRVEFKNGATSGWLLHIGVNTAATDGILNLNNKIIDCDFDTHAGTLEMFLLYNARNTQIIRPRFSNKASGPGLGLWQKCYNTKIINPYFNDLAQGIYYSVTVENTLIDAMHALNVGAPITGANTSDYGNFGLTQAQGLKIVNPVLNSGNSSESVGIRLGSVNDATVINPQIENYTIGILVGQGNNSNTANTTNWSIIEGSIKNGNPDNNVHALHPAIFISGTGGSYYGLIDGLKIYCDDGLNYQRYPIVFDGAYTFDDIRIVNNRLKIGTSGTSVRLQDSAILGSKIYINNNSDYTGTSPSQTDYPQVFNVKAYGATGDGTTDDTAAFVACALATDTTGGIIHVPLGTYIVSQFTISSRTVVQGCGIGSMLKLKNSTNNYMILTRDTIAGATTYPHDHQVRDLYFDLNNTNNTSAAGAIKSTKNRNMIVENCSFVNFKGNCILMDGSVGNNIQPRFINLQFDQGDRTDGTAIKLDMGCYDSLWSNVDIGRAWRGVIISNGGDGNHSLNHVLTWGHANAGTYLFQSDGVLFNDCTWDQNFGDGIIIDGCNGVSLTGCKASNNSFRDTANIFGFGVIGTVNVNSGVKVQNASSNINFNGTVFRNPNGGQKYGLEVKDTSVVSLQGGSIVDSNTAPISIGATARLSVKNTWGLNPDLVYAIGNSGTTKTIDRINGNYQTITMNNNCTFTFTSGLMIGDTITLELTQDSTGSRLATWPPNFKKVGGTLTLSTGVNAVDVIKFAWDGTNWVEVERNLNLS